MTAPAALLDRQTRARALIRSRTLAPTDRAFRTLGSYNEKDVSTFVGRVVPIVQAGQAQTGQMTSAYLNALIAQMMREDPAALEGFDVTDFRGVDPEEVYRRPFVDLWTGLGNGMEWAFAFQKAADRLSRLVDDDLSLAHRNAARDTLRDNDIAGYRRVIRPEMSSHGSCGLCTTASQHKYKSEDLLPIHTRCNCDVMPIIGARDPGQDLNDEDLGGRTDLASLPVQVAQHGELGPILRQAGQDVTTEADL